MKKRSAAEKSHFSLDSIGQPTPTLDRLMRLLGSTTVIIAILFVAAWGALFASNYYPSKEGALLFVQSLYCETSYPRMYYVSSVSLLGQYRVTPRCPAAEDLARYPNDPRKWEYSEKRAMYQMWKVPGYEIQAVPGTGPGIQPFQPQIEKPRAPSKAVEI